MVKRGKLEQSSRDHIFCKQKIGNKAQGLSLTTIIIAVIVIVVLVVLVYIFTGGAGRFSKDVEERGRKICFLQEGGGRCVKASECTPSTNVIGDSKKFPECGEGNVCCKIGSEKTEKSCKGTPTDTTAACSTYTTPSTCEPVAGCEWK